MLKRIFILIWLSAPLVCSAQTDMAIRDSVLQLFSVMRNTSDDEKALAATKLERLFTEFYSNPEKFEVELDSLPFLGQLSSSDGIIKMLCWNLALDNGAFQYHCVLRYLSDKSTVSITVFQDNDTDWRKISRKRLQPKDWYGVLYYRILTNKHRGKTYYTVLGWDGKDVITNRKIVDILTIEGNKVILGAGMFKENNRPAYRLIYEYANDATMTLNYDSKEKMIVMDHLVPEDSRFTGQYQFYGPDFSYDGLQFKKGKWVLNADIFTQNPGLNNLPKDQKPGSFND